jgi:thiol-disulfide isomerase/thioredoxin
MMRRFYWRSFNLGLLVILVLVTITACSSPQNETQLNTEITNEQTSTETNKEVQTKGQSSALDFKLDGLNQTSIDTTEVDKPMFVSFWATWCHYCREEMPHMDALYHEYDGQIEFAAINLTQVDSLDSVESYISDHGYSIPIYLDKEGTVMNLFKVVSTPTVVLLDPEGNEVYRKIGAAGEEQIETYRSLLDEMIADQDGTGGS